MNCMYVSVIQPSMIQVHIYDENTGIIRRNEEYEGVNALFELSLDINSEFPDAVNE